MIRSLASITCAVGFWLSLGGHAALAKPKVALTQIEGDATGDVRDAVAEAIEGKELSLIGSREVNRAVDKLGDLADLTEKDFKKLATELEADAIVAGKLDKVGSSRTLRFRLFVHKKMAKGFTMSFKDAKSEKFRTLLHDKLLDKIGITAPDGAGEDDDARPAKKAKAKAGDDEDDAVAAKKDKKLARKSKGDAKAGDEPEDPRPAKKSKAKAGDDEDARPAKAAKADSKADSKGDDEDRPARKAKAADADDDARPRKKPAGDDAPAAKGEDDARPAKGGDDDDPPRKTRKKVAAADDGDEIEGGVVATAEPARRGANRAAIRLDVGGSVLQRSLKFNSNIANKPKNVAIAPVPGLRLEAEVFPLALSSPQGALAGLGAAVAYDRTLRENLTTTNPTTNMSFTVPVKQSSYSVGVRYRLAFGKTETSPTLTVGVGYGKRLFSTDMSKLDAAAQADVRRDTPETDYTIIDPGLSFRLPVTRMIAFTLGGRGLLVTGAGPIQKPESYGRARVYGVDGLAAVDVVIASRFALRFSGEFHQIGFNFLGGGQLSNGLDGNLMTKEVGGLADRSIGGAATLAVMY
jgi:hypothetical protein